MPLRQFTTGVFSQHLWPGIGKGPRDECTILSDFVSVHGAYPLLTLPTIAKYREKAGVPDTDTKAEGLSLEDSMEALTALLPTVKVELYRGAFDPFLAKLKVVSSASVSVLAGSLPARLRYGFLGNHRVTVYWTGTALRILDPLAKAHSRGKAITTAELRTAMAAYPSAEVACVLLFG